MTPEEILTRWRLLRGWEPLCSGHISVTAHNSALDSLLIEHIRAWYRKALATYPLEQLPLMEFAAQTSLDSFRTDQSATLTLPPGCLRPASVALSTWHRPANIQAADSEAAQLQLNPYTAASDSHPVAIRLSQSALSLHPAAPGSAVVSLLGVPAPENNRFVLSPFLIADIWSDCRGIIPYKSSTRTNAMPTQITTSGATADAHRLLSTQLELMEQISGVSGGLMGRNMPGNASASLYQALAHHSTTALSDLLGTFADFIDKRNNIIATT